MNVIGNILYKENAKQKWQNQLYAEHNKNIVERLRKKASNLISRISVRHNGSFTDGTMDEPQLTNEIEDMVHPVSTVRLVFCLTGCFIATYGFYLLWM